jgi:hypothetical protein
MGGLTTADMAELATLDALFMPSTCQIVSTAPGTQNPDGSSEPGTTTTTTVACRFADGIQAAEVLAAMRLTVEANAILSVPLGTAATEADTVTYAGDSWGIVGSNLGASYATSLVLAIRLVR